MRPRSAFLTNALLVLVLIVPCAAQQSGLAPQVDSIRQAAMRADIAFLASDVLRGRMTGTPEVAVAAEFVKARFERLGLKPVGQGGSYFQPFNLVAATLGSGNRFRSPNAPLENVAADGLRSTGPELDLQPGQDYYPLRFSANAVARGEVVFAGFGIRREDYGEAVQGKIALVLDHEPGERDPNSPFDGLVASEASNPIRKTWLAAEQGAVAILFVTDVHNHPGPVNFDSAFRSYWPTDPPRVSSFDLADRIDRVMIPAAQISPELAARLLTSTSDLLRQLAAESEGPPTGQNRARSRGRLVELAVNVQRRTTIARNVVGLLEGSDPKLKDDWVIICGHHDHLGADAVQTFFGADDDASGVAAVMAIAEAYVRAAAQGIRPRRSILFASWDAEERGLLGAWAYTERPLAPLARIVAVMNLDMISRNEEVPAGGDSRFRGLAIQTAESNTNTVNVLGLTRFPALRPEIERANGPFRLELKTDLDNNGSQLLRRSDHWPFMQCKVPAVWFLTGLHPDYHTTWDRTDKLNFEKMERITRMVHQIGWNLAR